MSDPAGDGSTGDRQIFAVRYGTRQADREDVYLNFHTYGEPNAPMAMDYYFWVIRDTDRITLVDTGFSPAGGANRRRTVLCSVTDALGSLGIHCGDVGRVIVSHGHYDHIGNLDLFQDAEIVMSAREFDFWTGPMANRAMFAASSEPQEIAHLKTLPDTGRLTLFADGATVAPGIDLIEIGGHTPGMTITAVSTAGGTVVLASDAIHYLEEYERDWPFAMVADLPAMYRGFDVLREMERDGAVLIPGHDPQVRTRFPAGDADGTTARIA